MSPQESVKESLLSILWEQHLLRNHRIQKEYRLSIVRQKKIPVYRATHGGKKLMFKREETLKWMVEKRIGIWMSLLKKAK